MGKSEGRVSTEIGEDYVAITWYSRWQLSATIDFFLELVRRLCHIGEMRGFELLDPHADGTVLLRAAEPSRLIEELSNQLIARTLDVADLVINSVGPYRFRFEYQGGICTVILDVSQEYRNKHLLLSREVARVIEEKHSIKFPGLGSVENN